MRDEIDGRLWAEHGPAFAAAVSDWFADIMFGFRRLVAIEFAAPWRAASASN